MKKSKLFLLPTVFLSMVLILNSLFSGCISAAAPEKSDDTAAAQMSDDGRRVIHSKDKSVSLYIDEHGHFEFKDNTAGKSWYSIPQYGDNDTVSVGITKTNTLSELIVEYIYRSDENTAVPTKKTNSNVMCESSNFIKVSEIKNGFRVLYWFNEIKIGIPVEYKLVGNSLEASVDIKNIDEGKDCYLVSLQFLPYFGAAGPDIDGYLFIPDGCGAVAEFNKNISLKKAYEKRIYGADSAHSDTSLTSKEMDIRLPVFGLVHGNTALMGTVTEGAAVASVLARTADAGNYYNIVSSKTLYRIFAKDEEALYHGSKSNYIYTLTHIDFGIPKYTIKYDLLNGDDASYSGMAKKFQSDLIDTYSLKKSGNNSGLALRIYGALEEEKNFLGITYYKKNSLTSYEEAQKILTELAENGVEKTAVQYIGWSGNGVFNRTLPTSANPLSVLGGKKQLEKLKRFCKDSNVDLYLDVDLLHYKKRGNGVSVRGKATKSPNGDTAKLYKYSLVTYAQDTNQSPNYLLSMNYSEKYLNKYLKKYNKLGINTVSFSSFGNVIYSDFKTSRSLNRTVSALTFEKMLKEVGNKYDKVAVSGGNSYTLPFVDSVYDAPVSSSGYNFFTYDVPFYQMVASGLVDYTTPSAIQSVDYDTMVLKAVETGSDLLFDCVYTDASVLAETSLSYAYSSQYSIWKDKAINSYKQLKEVYSAIKGGYIVNHSKISNDVFCTEYSNGVKVYVNYNDTDIMIEDNTLASNGYLITEA